MSRLNNLFFGSTIERLDGMRKTKWMITLLLLGTLALAQSKDWRTGLDTGSVNTGVDPMDDRPWYNLFIMQQTGPEEASIFAMKVFEGEKGYTSVTVVLHILEDESVYPIGKFNGRVRIGKAKPLACTFVENESGLFGSISTDDVAKAVQSIKAAESFAVSVENVYGQSKAILFPMEKDAHRKALAYYKKLLFE